MLAELNSAKALFAIVFGLPVAVLVAAGVWLIPAGRSGVRAVISVVMAVLVGFLIWTVFQSSGQRVEASPPLAVESPGIGAPTAAPRGAPSSQPHAHSPSAPAAPGAACEPGGAQVEVVAKNLAFDKKCLAAPADKPFSIQFKNDDPGVPHNVAILSGGKQLFMGEIVTGPKSVTYRAKALPAGTYQFHCDVHPQMSGVFVSK